MHQQHCQAGSRTTAIEKKAIHRKLVLAVAIATLLCSAGKLDAQISKTYKPTAPESLTDTTGKSVEEKLVALALSGPMYQGGEHQNKIDELTLRAARNSWLNLLSVSANYNDQTFQKQNPNNAYVYPKFFTGVTIPLGTLFSRTGVKSAKESVEIGKINQDQLRRNIRTNVLTKYRQYTSFTEKITNQREVVDDYQAAYEQAKTKFAQDQITIEVHNTASKNYNDENAKLLDLQLQRDIVQLEIENMIGTNLDLIVRPKR